MVGSRTAVPRLVRRLAGTVGQLAPRCPCVAHAGALPVRVAWDALNPTDRASEPREASSRRRKTIEQFSCHTSQAPGRGHDALRPQRKVLSSVLDASDEGGAKEIAPDHVLMISVDLAAIERSTDREHHKAIDEVDDDPRRGTLGLLAAHGGLVPRACRAGRPEAPDTPTARGCTWRKVRVLHHPKFGVCVWGKVDHEIATKVLDSRDGSGPLPVDVAKQAGRGVCTIAA